ncbi:DNA internalization-related competence protein ComEC/Rec2 [Pelosinus propionicus]|uniref:Competence protein ComEC n=1 Tax=Pelosinus propionicus DSM 13327 TaxID=1123291 RepID=A0A1I4GQ06_9FIRM|nr:DNA internalization-related competence protein ComEC/Rec2 [Pelosinus propionicus]SFL32045.1 competence protein ComEC [Pelosinus propionicus DSM 13327]
MPNIIILITAAFTAGIWCASYFMCLLPFLYIGGFIITVILIWKIHKQQSVTWLLAVLFFIIGMLRFIHADALAINDISRHAGEKITVYATIEEPAHVTSLAQEKSRVSYVLSIDEVQSKNTKKEAASGKLYLYARQANQERVFKAGDKIRVTAEVIALHGYNNPGQYDSVASANLQGIRGRMSVSGNAIHLVSENHSFWKEIMEKWRIAIISNIERVMPPSHKAILVGMLFGGYGGIPRDVVVDFATTGIVHILSVSGSHIALVVGLITVLGKGIFRRFAFADQLIPLFAAIFITLYAVFCGLTPPVLRSLIMGLIGLGAVCFNREKDAAVALCLSVLGMLIYQPALIYDLSFQLSFTATAGLVFLNAQTVKILESTIPLYLARPLAVTIAAQLGVLPFLAWHFNSFSLSSFIANLFIVPIIEGIVILGLLGAFSSMIISVVGAACLVTCSLMISLVLQLAEWLADMPAAKLYVPSIGLAGSIVYYILVGWIYGYKPKNMLSLKDTLEKWPQRSAVAVLMLVFCIIVYCAYPAPLSVHFIDVGQGDAALIITPHGRAILVDTGGTLGESTDFDIGYRVLMPYLKHYGVLKIDYLFLTHGHQDHAGGAAGVAGEIPIKNIMLSRENYTRAVLNLLKAAPNSVRIAVYEGQKVEIDGAVVNVLHADTGLSQKQPSNEVSSVIQLRYGKHSFLFTGDLPAQGEDEMIHSGRAFSSTVLKVGHHGSKTSSTVKFLQAVNPEYAVISVGRNNSFGHPHEEVIDRLLFQGSKVYRTDEQGAIVFQTDGDTITVDTFLND